MRNPEAVFRNPAKLAEARRMLAEHQAVFVGLFGSDLIVVPGDEVPGKVDAFYRRLAQQAGPRPRRRAGRGRAEPRISSMMSPRFWRRRASRFTSSRAKG